MVCDLCAYFIMRTSTVTNQASWSQTRLDSKHGKHSKELEIPIGNLISYVIHREHEVARNRSISNIMNAMNLFMNAMYLIYQEHN